MNNIVNKLDINVLDVDYRIYQKNWLSIPHTHYFFEILYVLNGYGSFLSGNINYPIKKNNLILVNPYVIHTENSKSFDLEYIVIAVEGMEFTLKEEGFGILDINTQNDVIKDIINTMLFEYEKKGDSYKEFCNNLIYQLEIIINRHATESFKKVETVHVPKECSIVKNHIDVYYAEPLQLEVLSNLVHWNKYYLSHKFKDTYGISPMTYLQSQRIEQSKHILSGHDLSIAETSISCGFSSQSYFAQTFKRFTNLTPTEYREQARKQA